jgi:hypothetical protein
VTPGARDDRGSITPLVIGFALLVAVLVAVVVDASAAYLRRQGLNSLADAAALAATDGLQGDAVYTHGLGERAEIDPAAARRYVEGYLRSSGAHGRYPGLTWSVTTSGTSVVVRVQAPLDLPLRVPGIGGSATVTGTAAAVVVVSE